MLVFCGFFDFLQFGDPIRGQRYHHQYSACSAIFWALVLKPPFYTMISRAIITASLISCVVTAITILLIQQVIFIYVPTNENYSEEVYNSNALGKIDGSGAGSGSGSCSCSCSGSVVESSACAVCPPEHKTKIMDPTQT